MDLIRQSKNIEEERVAVVAKAFEDISNLNEEMYTHYLEVISKYEKERREMFKYLGTIAGGAAALSPQLLGNVQQQSLFYIGIGFLCLVVIVSITYVLSTIENNLTKLNGDFNNQRGLLTRLRGTKATFLSGEDRSAEAFKEAMLNDMNEIPKETSEQKKSLYRSMDYTGEFVVLFFVTGLSLLVLSLTPVLIPLKYIILSISLAFLFINIMSAFPARVFMILGFPIDLLKFLFRKISRRVLAIKNQ